MPTVVTALRGLDVPACVIADFDVLKEEDLLRRIFHGLAVLGRPIEADWKLVKDTLERRCPPLTTAQVRQQLTAILDGVKTIAFPEDAAERIRKEMRTVSAWAQVKSAGLQGLPSGQPTEVARRLLRTLRARGLFVVECGELERFVPSVGGHGPSWVVSALEKDLKNDRELETARRFVTDVARFNPSAEPLA